MRYYSFVFDDEIIETTIDKTEVIDGSSIYKLVLTEQEVSKQLGNAFEIKQQNGILSYAYPNAQTQTKYASEFLLRFSYFLDLAGKNGWFK